MDLRVLADSFRGCVTSRLAVSACAAHEQCGVAKTVLHRSGRCRVGQGRLQHGCARRRLRRKRFPPRRSTVAFPQPRGRGGVTLRGRADQVACRSSRLLARWPCATSLGRAMVVLVAIKPETPDESARRAISCHFFIAQIGCDLHEQRFRLCTSLECEATIGGKKRFN